MAQKKNKEKGIFLLMDPVVAEDLIYRTIFPLMETLYPEVNFAVILIEKDDDLKKHFSKFEPTVFIFDNDQLFMQKQHSYMAYDLMQRIIQQYPRTVGMMLESKNIFEEKRKSIYGFEDEGFQNICWFPCLETEKKPIPGELGVENILGKAFSDQK